MNHFPETASHNEIIVLVWIPRVTATLSSLGSLAIMRMILSDRKEKLKKPNHRLMLGLSTIDAFHSAVYLMTTLPSPVDSNIYGAIGNTRTCSAQGFFLMLGLAVPIYNTSLSLFFLLTIRYRMRQRDFANKIEPFLHLVSVLAPLALASVFLFIGEIKSGGVQCYGKVDDSIIKLRIIWWVVFAMVTLCFCINSCALVSISHYVVAQADTVRRYSYSQAQNNRTSSKNKATIVQSLLYTVAFFITFLFPYIAFFKDKWCFPLEVCTEIFYPLQGFWNFLLYTRPIIQREKRIAPEQSYLYIYWQAIFLGSRRNDTLMHNARNRRDMNTLDLDDAIVIELATEATESPQSPLQILGTRDNDEREESEP